MKRKKKNPCGKKYPKRKARKNIRRGAGVPMFSNGKRKKKRRTRKNLPRGARVPRFAALTNSPKAKKAYKLFHGKASDRAGSIEFPGKVTDLVLLGDAKSIDYDSTKKLKTLANKPATHRLRAYRHGFGKGVKMMSTPDGRFLIIGGGNFRVGKWLYK